jgi:hypothetical protein
MCNYPVCPLWADLLPFGQGILYHKEMKTQSIKSIKKPFLTPVNFSLLGRRLVLRLEED